jgi:hypothetical protein
MSEARDFSVLDLKIVGIDSSSIKEKQRKGTSLITPSNVTCNARAIYAAALWHHIQLFKVSL